jgi:hypothetical protein
MAERTARKPKKGAVATEPQELTKTPANVTHGDIALRAYHLYLARGCEHGHDVDDWLRAERELQGGLRGIAA